MKKEATKRALSLLEAAALLLLAYPAGLLVGLFLLAGELLGRVRILHKERFPNPKSLQKMVLVSNHPAIIDPFLIAYLLFRYYAWHPLKHAPLIVADRLNFYDKWWFMPFRPVMVPVDRQDKRKQAIAFLKIRKAIDQGRIIIIFPEGGRTFKGESGWLYCEKGNNTNGGRIRPLKGGVGLLVQKTEATIMPVAIVGSHKVVPNSKKRLWTRFNFWESLIINVGEPIDMPSGASREDVTEKLTLSLLGLLNEVI